MNQNSKYDDDVLRKSEQEVLDIHSGQREDRGMGLSIKTLQPSVRHTSVDQTDAQSPSRFREG